MLRQLVDLLRATANNYEFHPIADLIGGPANKGIKMHEMHELQVWEQDIRILHNHANCREREIHHQGETTEPMPRFKRTIFASSFQRIR